MSEARRSPAVVAVTGAAGFIGRHLITCLGSVGVRPRAIVHPETTDRIADDQVAVDLFDASATRRALLGVDGVIHLAARSGGVGFQRVDDESVYEGNRTVTDNVLDSASSTGAARVVVASSIVVYRPQGRPLTEDDPLWSSEDAPTVYARSKVDDEYSALSRRGLEVIVSRFGNVYGPGASYRAERSTVVHALIDRSERLAEGEPLRVWGDGSEVRSFVFIEDVARAVVLLFNEGAPRTPYNVDTGEAVTLADLAATVASTRHQPPGLVFQTEKGGGPRYRVASADRIRGLGFRPSITLAEGIQRTVEAYRNNRGDTTTGRA